MSRFLIAGGGIGGLAVALGLARQGHRAHVLEATDQFAELGAGIQLAANAFHALDRLGVGDAVRAEAVHVDGLRLMDGLSGATLAALPLGERYRQRLGNTYAVVHRGDLYAPLLRACRAEPSVTLRAGATVTRYRATAEGVRVRLASGEEVAGDALIGADGIRSVVRQGLLGDGPARVVGHTTHRAIVPAEAVPAALRWPEVRLWAGPGWHFIHYPVSGGRELNLVATQDDGATAALSGEPTPREEVLARFRELHPTPRALLELGREWRTWTLGDREPVDRWADGRVVLIGDAAHPIQPYAAQGACQALEDAVELAALLGPGTDPAMAFARFTEVRRERVRRVQQAARWMVEELYHPAGEAAAARQALLSRLGTEELYDALAWLHAYP
ncbi:FAD-dependent monooxygenase [Streptomyces sp. NPDC052396]|uniref:FAD-dependent monooxygenase n=1 Tax=Streptomyces sp. NPDC052396 TaxID=3365689 RepID=UPI0037D96E84